jgi:hypothetical protein
VIVVALSIAALLLSFRLPRSLGLAAKEKD